MRWHRSCFSSAETIGLYFQGLSIGPFRVGEYVQLRCWQRCDELVGLLEKRTGFAPHSYDQVYTDKGIGYEPFYCLHLLAEQGGVVASFHQPQYGVAARLQGDVEMGHEVSRRSHVFDDFVRQQVRFDGGDAVTFYSRYVVERFDQVEKTLSGRFPEIADVYTGQYNLFAAFFSHLAGLPYQALYRTVAATSPGVRDGTARYSSSRNRPVLSRSAGYGRPVNTMGRRS